MVNIKSLRPSTCSGVKLIFAVVIFVCLLTFAGVFHQKESLAPTSPDVGAEEQGEDLELSNLTQAEIDDLLSKDTGKLTLPEAEKLIIEYSKSLHTPELVNQFLRNVVTIKCDIEGEISEGSGVLIHVNELNEPEDWRVYTNAHITGVDPAKVRMCTIYLPRMAGSDETNSDVYEAVVVRVASNYPDVDFAELKVIKPGNIPVVSINPCSIGSNTFGDKVIVIGYPSGLTITNGAIINFPDGLVVETSARAYPGNSGGFGYNLSKDCGIGIVAWAIEDTHSALIQTWEMLGI